jgi:hypothetical protein
MNSNFEIATRTWGNWVKGYCPACGSKGTMFVASGQYITCSLDVCPNPTLLAGLLEKRDELRQAAEAGAAVCQVLAELVEVATGYEPSEDRYQKAVKAASVALRKYWKTEGEEVSP